MKIAVVSTQTYLPLFSSRAKYAYSSLKYKERIKSQRVQGPVMSRRQNVNLLFKTWYEFSY